MYQQHNDNGYEQALEKILRKTLVYGENTLMTEFRMEKNSALPSHKHPYEQTGYLVSGHIQLRIGAEQFDAKSGDSWCIPPNVEHGADIMEDTVAIEVFSPVREDYIPAKE